MEGFVTDNVASTEAMINLVEEGHLEQLRTVLLRELEDKISSSMLSTYLLALVHGDRNLVMALQDRGHIDMDVGFSIATPLQQVARCGSVWAVNEMLSHGAEFSGPGNTPDERDIDCAAESGNIEMLKDFIENRGLDPSSTVSRSCGVLAAACSSGSVACVQYILSRGLHVQQSRRDSQTLLHCVQRACLSGLSMLQVLLEHGFPADNTALCAAVSSGNFDIMQYLLERGVDINGVAGHCTHTALATLFINSPDDCLLDTLDFLLKNGALPHAVPGSGTPPLHLAYRAPLAAVQRLLDAGAPTHGTTNGQLNAPLCAFAQWKRCDLIHLLLSRGAHVNERDEKGYTPFIWAAIQGDAETMRLLLWRGADMGAADPSGQTYEQLLRRKPELLAEVQHWRDSLRWRQLPLLFRTRAKQAAAELGER